MLSTLFVTFRHRIDISLAHDYTVFGTVDSFTSILKVDEHTAHVEIQPSKVLIQTIGPYEFESIIEPCDGFLELLGVIVDIANLDRDPGSQVDRRRGVFLQMGVHVSQNVNGRVQVARGDQDAHHLLVDSLIEVVVEDRQVGMQLAILGEEVLHRLLMG